MVQHSIEKSKDIFTCQTCGSEMVYKDTRKRTYILLGGKKRKAYVERYFCEKCHVYRTILPDNLLPHKLYDKSVIEAVMSGKVTEKSYISLYGPSPITIKRWLSSLTDANQV
jgi:transcription initiation factor IIE alpha subunit